MGLDHFELEIESEASKIETVLQTKKGVLYAAIPLVFSYVNATWPERGSEGNLRFL